MSQASVFQCPNCHEYIASDARSCRFCSTPIDAQTAEAASQAQEIENRLYRRKQYARHMLTGSGLFGLGVLIAVVSFVTTVTFSGGGFYVVTYGLMLSGLGDFLYGLVGWLGEFENTSRRGWPAAFSVVIAVREWLPAADFVFGNSPDRILAP